MSQGPLSLLIRPMLDHIAHLDNGSRAELRRGEPTDPAKPALWRMSVSVAAVEHWLPHLEGDSRDRAERSLSILAWALSTAGDHAAIGATPFGAALREAKVNEGRFVRLLRARPDQLPQEVRACVRQLRAAQMSWDPTGLALLLSDGTAESREQWRRDLARHYFAADRALRRQAEAAR